MKLVPLSRRTVPCTNDPYVAAKRFVLLSVFQRHTGTVVAVARDLERRDLKEARVLVVPGN